MVVNNRHKTNVLKKFRTNEVTPYERLIYKLLKMNVNYIFEISCSSSTFLKLLII